MLLKCGITIEFNVVVLEVLATLKWKPVQRAPTHHKVGMTVTPQT